MKTSPCRRLPLHRLCAAWLAVLLTLFAAFAPALSHALAHEGLLQGIEVCTSSGTQIIPADSPAGSQSALSHSHCPFCLHNADRVTPPPHLLPYLFLDQGGAQERPVWQAFFFIADLYSRAAPRGPPIL
jgi:hypothetical protein